MSDAKNTDTELMIRMIATVESNMQNLAGDVNQIGKIVTQLQEQMNFQTQSTTRLENKFDQQYTDVKSQVFDKLKDLEGKNSKYLESLNSVEKDIVVIQSKPADQEMQKVVNEVAEIESRLGKVENQQSRWLGALVIITSVLAFVLARLDKVLAVFFG